MPKPDFVFQGPTTNTHLEYIKRFLNLPDIEKVTLSVAFVNEEGVRLIEEQLRPLVDKAVVFCGVRNDITSIQGLKRLFDLGIKLHIVDTGARSIIFHPKIYLVKTKTQAAILIGSANLTLGGLNNNIEASLALEMDLTNQQDKDFTNDVENQLRILSDQYPDNVKQITKEQNLLDLLEDGIVLDEAEVFPPHPVTQKESPDRDIVPRIRLNPTTLQRSIRKSSSKIKRLTRSERNTTATIPTNSELLWESKPLTERDLNIPSGTNTHSTGSINLDKGKLDVQIDHRHYFRDEVFNHLAWTPREDTIEEARANFVLVIKDISYGNFNLSIRHTADTSTRTYTQRNAMTRLSWGDARELIANRNLIGRSLSIYRDINNPEFFVIEID